MEPREDRSVSEDAIQKEVEQTLASLDRMERLEAGPAFFARLKVRLDGGEGWRRLHRLPLFPAFDLRVIQPIALAALILGNILTIVSVARANRSPEVDGRATAAIVAADYSLMEDLDVIAFTQEEAKR